MNKALSAAFDLLPIFRANTLRGLTRTRGYYAYVVGRDADTVDHALHLVGAACVLSCVPVAPIHFVEQVEAEWRAVFETAAFGSLHAGAWRILATASGLHAYSERDFDRVASALCVHVATHEEAQQAPHALWCALLQGAFAPAIEHYEQVMLRHASATLGATASLPCSEFGIGRAYNAGSSGRARGSIPSTELRRFT
jgi:hypothetical protein